MIVAYIFSFFVVILIVLFLLTPFLRRDKSTYTAPPPEPIVDDMSPQDIPLDLGRGDEGYEDAPNAQASLAQYEVEIEVAVKKVRQHKSTFANNKCPQCGRQLQQDDRFCASCGTPRESS